MFYDQPFQEFCRRDCCNVGYKRSRYIQFFFLTFYTFLIYTVTKVIVYNFGNFQRYEIYKEEIMKAQSEVITNKRTIFSSKMEKRKDEKICSELLCV